MGVTDTACKKPTRLAHEVSARICCILADWSHRSARLHVFEQFLLTLAQVRISSLASYHTTGVPLVSFRHGTASVKIVLQRSRPTDSPGGAALARHVKPPKT
jgi:hypothetical protein